MINKTAYTDHDLIIKIDTNLSNLTQKVDQLQTDTVSRIYSLEQRLDKIDVFHAQVDYEHLLPLIQWTRSLKDNYKLILGFGAFIIGAFAVLIEKLITFYFK